MRVDEDEVRTADVSILFADISGFTTVSETNGGTEGDGELSGQRYRSLYSPSMKRRGILIILAILNGVVLLGQIWPAGAPPFARGVNIAVLIADIALIGHLLVRRT